MESTELREAIESADAHIERLNAPSEPKSCNVLQLDEAEEITE